MTAYDPIELKRIRWRSRRGLLELDLVLEKFFAGPFGQLAPAQIDAYRRLLDLPDTDFLDVVNGKADLDDSELMAIVAILRSL
ncbi:FAD assembly factor SdhE [Chromobacterium violaceum]|uniref:FAD assembly factor SdhE n=1 Tax=Chromobacterium violaceum TaxID=536 RepID=A0AAX2M499_CHRVL|nr:succinate dehydrogenase assembly factor 2 [Chromobacterium violaceum]OLZ79559.1 succinate dehydrogenase assembly factor 2 [Chromobacterium violaceum]STB71722.1 Flavinator of succinate dehydrogenase [Chromobacterium violaceum]SUX31293.1 Flavinator of succinate dehydrogenase [Chromobacterium violaceum]